MLQKKLLSLLVLNGYVTCTKLFDRKRIFERIKLHYILRARD